TPARQGVGRSRVHGRLAAKADAEGDRRTPPPRRPPHRNQSAPWPVSGLASGKNIVPAWRGAFPCLGTVADATPVSRLPLRGQCRNGRAGGVTGFPFQPCGACRRVTSKRGRL